jgi:hypothetical protein
MALMAPLALATGCGEPPPLPPGGTAAVAYWHRVLHEHPDLPDRVRSVVRGGNWRPYYTLDFPPPVADIRIYTEQGETSFSSSRIELLITDLDSTALEQLLEVWEAIPEQAAELGLSSVTYKTSSPRRKIVVLGSEGRVDIGGVGDSNTQSIRVLADEIAATTLIGIHTFGPSGERALEELGRNYQSVRGPPTSEVRSGHVSLPPPDDALSVLIIGKLRDLNIGSAYGDATQEIHVATYFNGHSTSDDFAGKPAGSPFADRVARQVTSPEVPYSSSSGYAEAGPAPARASAEPYVETSGPSMQPYIPAQTPQVQAPTPIQPWTSAPRTFNPPLVVPMPVFSPPPYRAPARFR